MKKYIVSLVLLACLITSQAQSQSVNLENSFLANTDTSLISFQRIEVGWNKLSFKYDYKSKDDDVFGIILSDLISGPNSSLNFMAVRSTSKQKDEKLSWYAWGNHDFDKFSVRLDLCRIYHVNGGLNDFNGGRIWNKRFTAETYIYTNHSMLTGIKKTDQLYAWLAYHPEHAFVSLGLAENEKEQATYWGFAGTRNLDHFGIFSLGSYNSTTGDFWFKSQSGFGEINQDFFCQDNYIVATDYLVVPAFFHLHFSQITTKGTYTLKVEGRRTNGSYNFETMMGKKIGNDLIRVAVGANSEYFSNFKLAPSFELYKSWKKNDWKATIELRYDLLYKACTGYLIFRY